MSRTSKSPRRVARAALHVGERSLPRYAHRCAPRTYTQAQLLACLVLKCFWSVDYRSAVARLQDNPTLLADLGLERVPHFTTLHKAHRRLLRFDLVRSLLGACVRAVLGRREIIRTAAVDATGFEAGQVSPYFVKRRARAPNRWQTTTYTRFPKLGLIGDCRTHLALAAFPSRGPSPDVHQLELTLGQLVRGLMIEQLLGDAGYDSEANHESLRDHHGIRSLIPPKIGRPSSKPARGRHRRLMQQLFQHPQRTRYGQRWQVETIFSMIKRNLGDAIREHTYWSQGRGMLLKVLTHNVMILLRGGEVFYGALPSPFLPPTLFTLLS